MPKIKGWTRTMAKGATNSGGKLGRAPNGMYGVFLRWEHDDGGHIVEIAYNDDQEEDYGVYSMVNNGDGTHTNQGFYSTKADAVDRAKEVMRNW